MRLLCRFSVNELLLEHNFAVRPPENTAQALMGFLLLITTVRSQWSRTDRFGRAGPVDSFRNVRLWTSAAPAPYRTVGHTNYSTILTDVKCINCFLQSSALQWWATHRKVPPPYGNHSTVCQQMHQRSHIF